MSPKSLILAVALAGLGVAQANAAVISYSAPMTLETTEISHFGSTACKAQYRCLACMEPFDYFKPY